MISVEEWDTRYWQILADLEADIGMGDATAEQAEQECTEQFGPRPEETP